MHILFYEQAVCKRGTKIEKKASGLMDSKMVIAMLALCFNGEARDHVCTVQRTEAKEDDNSFLRESFDTPQPNRNAILHGSHLLFLCRYTLVL